MKQKTQPPKRRLPKSTHSTQVLPPDAAHPEKEAGDEDREDVETLDQEPAEAENSDFEPNDSEIESSLPSLVPPSGESEVSSAVSTNDPLRRYLEEISRYDLLDPTEEFELAAKLRESGDLQAAKALVTANLRLVVKIAFEYRTYYSNLLDLIQEGNIGLMKAVSKYDPSKGARLGYYASWWIRSYILKYLLDNFRLVKVGTTQAQKKLFYHLMREKEKLEAQGLFSGPRLLAEKLNVREKDVIEMEQRLSGHGAEVSLDAPFDPGGEGKKSSHLDSLVDEQEKPDETLAREEILKLLQERLPEFEQTLNEKELQILNHRLLAEEPKTLQEVANLYGLTRERARQIEVKVIEKLRDFLNINEILG